MTGEAQRLLVELEERSRRGYVQPTVFAIVYMGLGQGERLRLAGPGRSRTRWMAR
jgi:hypothetical protein